MKRLLCAMAACLAVSAPASAAIIVGSVTGVLASDATDTGGDFGVPGSLAGKAYTFDFSYDTALLTQIDTGPGLIRGVGGDQYSQADFFTKAQITINGITRSIKFDGYNGIEIHNGPYDHSYAVVLYESPQLATLDRAVFILLDTDASLDLSTPANSLSGSCWGGFRLWSGTSATSEGSWSSCDLHAAAYVPPTPDPGPDPSPVPEPATWAAMIAGLGGVGFALRRHRRQAIA